MKYYLNEERVKEDAWQEAIKTGNVMLHKEGPDYKSGFIVATVVDPIGAGVLIYDDEGNEEYFLVIGKVKINLTEDQWNELVSNMASVLDRIRYDTYMEESDDEQYPP